ncbi:extracellular superoxide dismutase [Cu-Zn]-like [Hemitrygon akajei]|uniref:extracellular superoxide dismutase [Cu-Zn]-like n=1 Tax=Hemitrygon akajei TaxID=2704970 RepID=UPI003BFA0546
MRVDKSPGPGKVFLRPLRERGDQNGILLDLHGFSTSQKAHGVHIHEFGDLTRGCETLGGHYNPHNRRHGSHAGDLGNFRPNATGDIYQTIAQMHLHLHGPHSIIGRSVVIHENEDDMGHRDLPGSTEHGNAGLRLACCVIGVSSQRSWPQE